MATNKTECDRLEQICIIQFLMAEKCKSYEMYKMVDDVYEKNFYIELNMGLPLKVKKTVDGVETYWLFHKENIPVAAINK